MNTILETVKIGDHVLRVTPQKALEIRQKIAERQERDRRISRDLHQSGMLPRDYRNPTTKITGSNYDKTGRTIDNRQSWIESKKQTIEDRWQEHLKREFVA